MTVVSCLKDTHMAHGREVTVYYHQQALYQCDYQPCGKRWNDAMPLKSDPIRVHLNGRDYCSQECGLLDYAHCGAA